MLTSARGFKKQKVIVDEEEKLNQRDKLEVDGLSS